MSMCMSDEQRGQRPDGSPQVETPGRAPAFRYTGPWSLISRFACFVTVLAVACSSSSAAGTLPALQVQSRLVAGSGKAARVIWMIEPGEQFQGFGFLDHSHVFAAATTSECGGACSDLEIIEEATGRRRRLYTLGATGDSEFAVSPDGTWVAFTWPKGIWVFSTPGILADLAAGTYDARTFEKRLRLVAKCEPCWGLKWVGPTRISFCVSTGEYPCTPGDVDVAVTLETDLLIQSGTNPKGLSIISVNLIRAPGGEGGKEIISTPGSCGTPHRNHGHHCHYRSPPLARGSNGARLRLGGPRPNG